MHVMKAFGEGVIPPFIRNLCTSCTYRSHTVYFTSGGKVADSYWAGV